MFFFIPRVNRLSRRLDLKQELYKELRKYLFNNGPIQRHWQYHDKWTRRCRSSWALLLWKWSLWGKWGMLGRFWGTRRRCRVTTTHWRPERHTVTRKNIQSIQFLSCLVTVNKETPSGFISSSVMLIVMICVTLHRLHLCSYRPHCIPGQRKGWVCSKSQIWIKTFMFFDAILRSGLFHKIFME